MADKRGLVASYPFAVQAPEEYQPRNEERFRAQMAQANADIMDRLANLEQDVADLQAKNTTLTADLVAATARIEVLEELLQP